MKIEACKRGGVKSHFVALRAKLCFWRGCVKRFFMALSAELCSDRHVIFTISLREIVKMTCLSEEYSAAEGGIRLFTPPLKRDGRIDWTCCGKAMPVGENSRFLSREDLLRKPCLATDWTKIQLNGWKNSSG